jgi:hypothetical protein
MFWTNGKIKWIKYNKIILKQLKDFLEVIWVLLKWMNNMQELFYVLLVEKLIKNNKCWWNKWRNNKIIKMKTKYYLVLQYLLIYSYLKLLKTILIKILKELLHIWKIINKKKFNVKKKIKMNIKMVYNYQIMKLI